MGAKELLEFGLVDALVPEPVGGAHHDHAEAAENLRTAILSNLEGLAGKPTRDLLAARYKKYRAFGRFTEAAPSEAPSSENPQVGI